MNELEAIRYLMEAGNILRVMNKEDIAVIYPDLEMTNEEWIAVRDFYNDLDNLLETENLGQSGIEEVLGWVREESRKAS